MSVSAVVVHHNRHDIIGKVVQGLLDTGISPERLIVVDNSESPEAEGSLRAAVSPARVVFVENHGYGAAANDGLAALATSANPTPYTLIATHEVEVSASCIQQLASTLDTNPSLGAVGPALRSGLPDGDIWSIGGGFTRITHCPVHRKDLPVPSRLGGPAECAWLDGALVLYRNAALPKRPFDESFFLYMEEVDLHLRLRLSGWLVAVLPTARAAQQSDGTPPFYFARNLRQLNRRHLPASRRWIATAIPIIRRAGGLLATGKISMFRQILSGSFCVLPPADSRVLCVNPLGGTLGHYVAETSEVLENSGVLVDTLRVLEPSAGGGGRRRWLFSYVAMLRAAERLRRSMSRSAMVVTWPVLGLYDVAVLRALARHATLVVHDPVPLVRAVGYGRLARFLARRSLKRVSLMTHSSRARRELAGSIGVAERDIGLLPHPMRLEAHELTRPTRPSLLVMGQFKPDRDVRLLEQIAARISSDVQLRIVGRGWPDIAGWEVDPRFVSEEEFQQQLEQSSAVLIPYSRFYQSGVAVRAVEVGLPVVGPRRSVLQEVLGETSPWLADEDIDSWLRAIASALSAKSQEIREMQLRAFKEVQAAWRSSRLVGELLDRAD